MSVEKNNNKMLEFYADPRENKENGNNLSFNWMMELQKGDTIRLKVTHGKFGCGSYWG